MPFGLRVSGWGFVIEVVAGVSDELFEGFWGNPNTTSTSEGISKLAEEVVKVGAGGAVVTESRDCIKGASSLIQKASKSTLIAVNLVEVVSNATPNLLI
jgi:uncharacterized Fe-S cluster protein YjdI